MLAKVMKGAGCLAMLILGYFSLLLALAGYPPWRNIPFIGFLVVLGAIGAGWFFYDDQPLFDDDPPVPGRSPRSVDARVQEGFDKVTHCVFDGRRRGWPWE